MAFALPLSKYIKTFYSRKEGCFQKDWHMFAYQGLRNVLFFWKFGVLCFLVTSVLRFSFLTSQWRTYKLCFIVWRYKCGCKYKLCLSLYPPALINISPNLVNFPSTSMHLVSITYLKISFLRLTFSWLSSWYKVRRGIRMWGLPSSSLSRPTSTVEL